MNELRYSNRKKSIMSKLIESDILRRIKSNEDVSESHINSEKQKLISSEILKCEYSGIDISKLNYINEMIYQA